MRRRPFLACSLALTTLGCGVIGDSEPTPVPAGLPIPTTTLSIGSTEDLEASQLPPSSVSSTPETTAASIVIDKCIVLHEGISVEDCGDEVMVLEEQLIDFNCLAPAEGIAPDRVFDAVTGDAVELFQKVNSITVDRLAGPETARTIANVEERMNCAPLATTMDDPIVTDVVESDTEGTQEADVDASTTTILESGEQAATNPCLVDLHQGIDGCEQEIKDLQSFLISRKCIPEGLGIEFDVDGKYGPMTTWAVKMFQLENGIEPIDGVVGTNTRAVMNRGGETLECLEGDQDKYDRLSCPIDQRCLLVHKNQENGLNTFEVIDEDGAIVEQALANTGKAGNRTQNTIVASIFNETFSTEESEQKSGVYSEGDLTVTRWGAVRQIFVSEENVANGDDALGLMYDPHTFLPNGSAFHGRVSYSGQHDDRGASIPTLDANGNPVENTEIDGGYHSHGCVHLEWSLINFLDDTFLQEGVEVRVLDQPTS